MVQRSSSSSPSCAWPGFYLQNQDGHPKLAAVSHGVGGRSPGDDWQTLLQVPAGVMRATAANGRAGRSRKEATSTLFRVGILARLRPDPNRSLRAERLTFRRKPHACLLAGQFPQIPQSLHLGIGKTAEAGVEPARLAAQDPKAAA